MKRFIASTLLALEVFMSVPGNGAERGKTPPPTEIMDTTAPVVSVTADPQWLVGFPMVVAVTVANTTEGTTWTALPAFDLLSPSVPVAFTFVGPDGRRSELACRNPRGGEGPPDGFDLGPGDSRTMVFDLSELSPPVTAGTYTLEAELRTRRGTYPAAPVRVTLAPPTPEDAAAAGRWRAAHNAEEPSWSRFLDMGRAGLPEVDFSPEGWRALAFHEAVHRAVYGGHALKDVDPALFDGFREGPLSGEAALVRLELWLARGDTRAAKLREKIPAQWPGLKWRVAEIAAGQGWLARLRRNAGARP